MAVSRLIALYTRAMDELEQLRARGVITKEEAARYALEKSLNDWKRVHRRVRRRQRELHDHDLDDEDDDA